MTLVKNDLKAIFSQFLVFGIMVITPVTFSNGDGRNDPKHSQNDAKGWIKRYLPYGLPKGFEAVANVHFGRGHN